MQAIKKGNATTGDTGVGPSWSIWHDCPWMQMIHDPGVGACFFDDFLGGHGEQTLTTVATVGPYEMFAESGGSFTGAVDEQGGAIDLISGTTGDADVVMTLGGGAPFVISDTASLARKLWFEARWKISAVTDDAVQYFIGMCQEDRAAATGIFSGSGSTTIGTAMSDIDYIGFIRYDGGTTGLQFAYNLAGQSDVEKIAATGLKTASGATFALVANTYVKTGFVYDPNFNSSQRIKVFINGVEQSTYVTATNIATATVLAFPDGEEMTIAASAVSDSTTSGTMTLDWWRVAQLR